MRNRICQKPTKWRQEWITVRRSHNELNKINACGQNIDTNVFELYINRYWDKHRPQITDRHIYIYMTSNVKYSLTCLSVVTKYTHTLYGKVSLTCPLLQFPLDKWWRHTVIRTHWPENRRDFPYIVLSKNPHYWQILNHLQVFTGRSILESEQAGVGFVIQSWKRKNAFS